MRCLSWRCLLNRASCLPQAFNTLHVMHHEATACHVTGDIVDLLSIVLQVLKVARQYNTERKGE